MTAPLTPERLAEIRALAEAATPGDWRAVAFSSVVGCPIMTQPDKTKNSVVIAGVHGAFGDDYRAEVEANAAFIGLGPKTTLALLDALTSTRERAEKAEARVAVLEGPLREAGGWSGYEDEIAEAISDSMDMDWTSQDGAGRGAVSQYHRRRTRHPGSRG